MSHEADGCPECSSPVLEDPHRGERFCSTCGIVVEAQMLDYGPESSSASAEERTKLARATGQTTYAQHDFGLATDISLGTHDFSGAKIRAETARSMESLRKWQKRTRVASPKDRRLANVLIRIKATCEAAKLPSMVRETAAQSYRRIGEQMDLRGKSVTSISVAFVYMACKQCSAVRSWDEITRGICEPKDAKKVSKLAARYYRDMVIEAGRQDAPSVTMEMYVSKIANLTGTDARVERLALEMVDKTREGSIADGKAPNGIAAAYLYLASTLLGQSMLQKDVSYAAGVTDVTIRNRCKDILACYKMSVALRPVLGASRA